MPLNKSASLAARTAAAAAAIAAKPVRLDPAFPYKVKKFDARAFTRGTVVG